MDTVPLISSLLPLQEVKLGSCLLDLGCGGGSLKYASYPGVRFVGVDRYSDPRSRHWPESCSLVLASGDRLPFADGSFDGAICNFVFEHLERPEPTLRELSRLIRPDGFLFV